MLVEVAYKRFMHSYDDQKAWTCVTVVTCGSRIIFSCGLDSLDTCWLDTSTPPLKFFQVSSSRKITRRSYDTNTRPLWCNVTLGDVDGKLYRISKDCIRSLPFRFSGFDFKKEAWLPLATPPFIQTQDGDSYCAFFMDAAKKIIGWDRPKHEGREDPRVFCFDTTNPENGCTCLGNNDLVRCCREYRTFVFHNCHPFFVPNHHPRLGDYHVIFGYEPGTLKVTGLLLSDDFLNFQFPYIETNIQLPPSCSEFTTTVNGHVGSDDADDHHLHYVVPSQHSAEYKFVHLGGEKVAIVLYKYVGQGGCRLLIAEFEYEFTNCGPTIEVQTRLIRTRRFRYLARHLSEPGSDVYVTLNGAFLL